MAKSVFSTYVTGKRRLDKKLDKLEDNVRSKLMRRNISKAGTVLRKAIAAAAPVGETKKLKKSIGKSTKKVRGASGGVDFQGLRVGTNVGKKGEKQAPHAHLVVLGTKKRTTTEGKSTGRMKKNNFVKKAAKRSMRAAVRKLRTELLKDIQKEARK